MASPEDIEAQFYEALRADGVELSLEPFEPSPAIAAGGPR